MNEIDIVVARLASEEGFVGYLYDDKDPKRVKTPVKAPAGNATIGYGENVQAGWPEPFARAVMKLRLEMFILPAIQDFPWYAKCNAARRSVFLDIAFNDGVHGLLGFPHMLAAVIDDDWATAQAQCKVTNPELAGRYAHLGQILLSGEIAGPTVS